MLVEEYLVAVVSLPAGVFNPYSGVKTSILILDKSLAKKADRVAFFKIESEGFDLGAQRRADRQKRLASGAGGGWPSTCGGCGQAEPLDDFQIRRWD